MTTYRLFPATNGPSAPVAYTGNFLAGVLFKVTSGGMWLTGYWHWVPAGGDTTARKFALWAIRGAGTGTLISAATVTSGTLTAGSWNQVTLGTPVPLAIGTGYCACTGWTATGFPDSDTTGAGTGASGSYGTGGHTAGITNGPLTAFSDGVGGGGTKPEPYGTAQGCFSTAGNDPALIMPASGSNSANFWMDVSVSDTGPAGYGGPYRLWPNKYDANPATVQDAAVNYDVATEFALSQSCALNKVWYYSPPGTAQLATAASVWHITGTGTTGTLTAQAASPSWSGAAGSGWVSCSFSGTVLPAGKYKVSVYNAASVPDGWSPKDANTDYFRGGEGGGGITWGPLSAPNLAGASTAYTYDGSAGGATPPFQNGTTQAGQPTFSQGPPDRYPYLFAPVASPSAGSTQVYWVDVEVTPASQAQPATATAAGLAPAPAVTAPGTTLAHPAAAAAAAAAWPPVFTQVDISVTAGPTASRAQVPAAGLTDDDGTHAGPVTADRSP